MVLLEHAHRRARLSHGYPYPETTKQLDEGGHGRPGAAILARPRPVEYYRTQTPPTDRAVQVGALVLERRDGTHGQLPVARITLLHVDRPFRSGWNRCRNAGGSKGTL